MNERDKAEHLINKMLQKIPDHYDDWNIAKRCALICVEEILQSIFEKEINEIEYYQKLKTEILTYEP